MSSTDQYAPARDTTEGRVFTVTGGDWDTVLGGSGDPIHDERIVVNMGPQHPSTHGVLRLVLELEGETVTEARTVIGYLHTGIEKNLEYRNWTQGTTFVTRMDYLAPIFNETGYCLAVEKLLGIEDQITERARVIRVMMMELNRIASHLVWLATTGMELGALSMMIYGFREREFILDIFEMITGLRMNMAYVRPGGVSQDVPDRRDQEDPRVPRASCRTGSRPTRSCSPAARSGPGVRRVSRCWTCRVAWRSASPARCSGPPACRGTCARPCRTAEYETYDFDVITSKDADVWGRYQVRLGEMRESLKIVQQAMDRLKPGPVMIEDRKIAWPAQLAVGQDGLGNSLEHIAKIMGQSMESLIHHFKLVTEGFRVPAGPGLHADRGAARRARRARRLRRWHPALPRALSRTEFRQPAGHPRDGRRRPAGRRNRRGRLVRPRHGWV